MWKDFFSFTKQERQGIFILFALIAGICIGKFLFSPKGTVPEEKDVVVKQRVEKQDYDFQSLPVNPDYCIDKPAFELKPFDPNTADSVMFVSLGLKPYIAKNIIKYRNKGGIFRKPDDFGKIYGLNNADFEKLKPYVRIQSQNESDKFVTQIQKNQPVVETTNQFSKKEKVISSGKQEKLERGATIDINIADTIELKKIPGIGAGFAKRIVKYRQILGGFYSLEQIKEVYGVDNDLFLKIIPYMTISENADFQRIPVNQSSLDKLKSHPYINFYQAKVLLELRKKKGKIRDISELVLFEEFSKNDLERLTHYLTFE